MQSDKFPISIAGIDLKVDETFDGSPAIFTILDQLPTGQYMVMHVSDDREKTLRFQPGDVIIIAKLKEHKGFPHYIYTSGGCGLRYFFVRLDGGEQVMAYVDPGNQVNKTWRRASDNSAIPSDRVTSFSVIDGDPAFPETNSAPR